MNFDKLTQKVQKTLQAAQALAVARDNTAIFAVHLLSAMIEDESVRPCLFKLGRIWVGYKASLLVN